MTEFSKEDTAWEEAARPYLDASSETVSAVGIGPGDRAYLTSRARKCIRDAGVVLGFETVVGYIRPLIEGDTLACGYDDEAETLARFGRRVRSGELGVAVMMGDPTVSGQQFLTKIERAVDRPLEVVPGISSIQIAAGRARTPLEETTLVSLHKRGPIDHDLERLVRDVGERHLHVLPRPFDWMPEDIAVNLLDNGAEPSLEAIVLERLTLEDETITSASIGELARSDDGDESRFSDLSILVVRRGSG